MDKKPKINKYEYLWIVQGYYGKQYGWEDVYTAESYREARSILKDYRLNENEYPHRMIHRRELNPLYVANQEG